MADDTEQKNVFQLHKPYPAQEIVPTLRRIIDDIEAGEHGLVTTAIIVVGHTTDTPAEIEGEREMSATYEVFATGPRCDLFTVRGLLATALRI